MTEVTEFTCSIFPLAKQLLAGEVLAEGLLDDAGMLVKPPLPFLFKEEQLREKFSGTFFMARSAGA